MSNCTAINYDIGNASIDCKVQTVINSGLWTIYPDDGTVMYNGKKFGRIIAGNFDKKTKYYKLKVEITNGNKYMNGRECTISFKENTKKK